MNVWVFAEERTGSTWLCDYLARKLGKVFSYVEEDGVIPDAVHQTHEFERLEDAEGVILRTARADRFDHFLSWALLDHAANACKHWWREPHLRMRCPKSDVAALDDFIEQCPIIVPYSVWNRFRMVQQIRDVLWSLRTGPKQTIYYEELFEGVDIPALGLHDVRFSSSHAYVKLPYTKVELVSNWRQVQEWVRADAR